MAKILLLHGPNLNLLGSREPTHYGNVTLDAINQQMINQAKQDQHEITVFQSNAEHELVDEIQQSPEKGIDFILINPAAFTHTSVAIRDALSAVGIPFIEIHLSNVHAREEFRRHSFLSDIALGVICGFGAQSYQLALAAATTYLKQH